jgi:hypothetical protein
LAVRRPMLISAGIVVFVIVAVFVGRWLQTESRERSAVLTLLDAEARGDARAMLDQLAPSCRADPRCAATVGVAARRARRAGSPKIIAYDSKTAYALGAATGVTRVAWTIVDRGLPVVQCVVVHRGGSVISGRTVSLLRISAPIGNESTC